VAPRFPFPVLSVRSTRPKMLAAVATARLPVGLPRQRRAGASGPLVKPRCVINHQQRKLCSRLQGGAVRLLSNLAPSCSCERDVLSSIHVLFLYRDGCGALLLPA